MIKVQNKLIYVLMMGFFAFQMPLYGDQDEIEALIRDLGADDHEVRSAAENELEDIEPRERVHELIDIYIGLAIEWKEPLRRREIKNGLVALASMEHEGVFSPQTVSPALENVLTDENRNAGELSAAVALLRGIGPTATREMMPVLNELLVSRDESALLREIILAIRESGKAEEAVYELARAAGHQDRSVAEHSAYTIKQTAAVEGSVSVLVELLNDKDSAVRLKAVRGLKMLCKYAGEASRSLVDAMTDAFEDIEGLDENDVVFIKTASETLAAIGPEARDEAASALDGMPEGEPAEMLRAVTEHIGRRKTLVETLVEILGEKQRAVPAYIDVLKTGDPEQQIEAVEALRKTGPDAAEAIPHLVDAGFKEVRRRAVAALTAIGDESVPALLVRIGKEPEEDLRKDMVRAVGKLEPPVADVLAELSVVARDDPSAEIRRLAISVLGELEPESEQSSGLLVEALKDHAEVDSVRLEVVGILSEASRDVRAKLVDDPGAVETLSSIVLDVEIEVDLRIEAVRLHPAARELAPDLIGYVKDASKGDLPRSEALMVLNKGGAEVAAIMADDPAMVDLLRRTSLPWRTRSLRLAAVDAMGLIGEELPSEAYDWPMWRYDAGRSAATPHDISEELHLQWVRELPEPKRAWRHQLDDRGKLDFDISYVPVVKGDTLFVPSNVSDGVTAYSVEDGAEQWRFYADGPVRLAPAVWGGKVFFISDDGHLYCVDADTGELGWKFRGGPSDHRLLGNERIINFWPARGGPVVTEGTVYFTAGIWPLHGVFIYALEAETGEVKWVNDTTSSDYVALPHSGAYGHGGLAPQGYIALDDAGDLIVSAGRGYSPVHVDRISGEVTDYSFRGVGDGDYAVHAGGMGFQRNEMIRSRLDAVSDRIGGDVFYKLAARDRLFVTTEDGTLYCFGPDETEPQHYDYNPSMLSIESQHWAEVAEEVVERMQDPSGYALMLGAGSGDLMRELLTRTELHVVVAEADAGKIQLLRDELVEAGKYGRRAAVIEAHPAAFSVQPYLFSLVISEDIEAAGIKEDTAVFEKILDLLRPYSGLAWLGTGGVDPGAYRESAASANVDQVSVEAHEGYLLAERTGPLSGAGQWTHQYHDAANTLLSQDERVRLPLGLLWFGGPNNHNILPRHSGGPRPQVAGGRQVFLGPDTIAARCVYTGRELWEREFPDIGMHGTHWARERDWKRGRVVDTPNIPGSTYIGSPYVTQPDSVYLRYDERIHRIDMATGETLDEFPLPGRSIEDRYGDIDVIDWGTLRVVGNVLLTTAEPHLFEDQSLGSWRSYSGTSSRLLAALDRYTGELLWKMEADMGFRHNAIVAADGEIYVIDGLSENAVDMLARRGEVPEEGDSQVFALDMQTGEKLWSSNREVFGTFLIYSEEHDILIEGGSRDMRFSGAWIQSEDEPRQIMARRGADGEVIWDAGDFILPAAVRDDMLIPGRPRSGPARSLLTGEFRMREQPHTGSRDRWRYSRRYGCNTMNASQNLLLFRTGYAGYFDLEHDTGTGTFSGFRSGCTANMIAADGVLNALDYTRTCTCSYPHQTSLAMIPMPGDSNIEFWTRYDGSRPDPANHGRNYGAPGRRVDVEGSGRVWYDEPGTIRRHASAIVDNGGGLDWVAASAREVEEDETLRIEDIPDGLYTVRLHFAELVSNVGEGQRVFDISIDGEELLGGYDIVGRTGGTLRGDIREFSVGVSDNSLEIGLRRTENSDFPPLISGIELIAEDK